MIPAVAEVPGSHNKCLLSFHFVPAPVVVAGNTHMYTQT